MDQKRKKAVRENDRKGDHIQRAMIEPYFHAVSVGMTLDASEWFGKRFPYIRTERKSK